ncbi:MAG: amino acid adenylation domain-containing protein [Phenylobacterium sp.]|jgi:amino acid adenylation domain-containing protein
MNDLGQALTRQQQLLNVDSKRYFWLSFAELDMTKAQSKLQQLMLHHQVLSCDYGVPQGFDVVRSVQQAPRLDFRVYDDVVSHQSQLEQQAKVVFTEQAPHLLCWCWPQNQREQGGVKVLLAASALTLDDYSVDKIYQLLDDADAVITVPDIQYGEYRDWINTLLNDEQGQAGIEFWQNLSLKILPEARLNECQTGDNHPDRNDEQSIAVELPQVLQQQVLARAGQYDCQPAHILLNVWAVLLGKLSGVDALKLDYFHDCRHDYEEFDTSLGLFTQPLPMPFYQLDSCDLPSACLGSSALLTEMLEYQEYVSAIDSRCHAGFYWHQQAQQAQMQSGGLVSHCPLLMHYSCTAQGAAGLTLCYNSARYQQQAMQRLSQRYLILLAAVLAQPNQPIQQHNCWLADEHPQAVTELAIKDNFVELFSMQAQAFPNHRALTDGDIHYSYQQLDQLSNQYAGVLQQAGAGKEQIVALCLPRGAQSLIILLAILKTGAAYLPLDVEQPQARLQQIINDANPLVLVSEEVVSDNAALVANQIVTVAQLQQTVATFTPVTIALNQLAYVLYTSGSTGQPKGVQVEHQQLMHYSQSVIEQLALPQQGNYGLISTLVADLGNTMLFPGWLTASCVILLDKDELPPLDCLKIVPSHLEALLCSDIAVLKAKLPTQVLVLGGEPISHSLLQQLTKLTAGSGCRIYNHYGPTETTVGVLYGEVDLLTPSSRLTTAIGDSQIYLLDNHQQATVSGQCGELVIAGSSVSRGYLNDSKRTSEVFVNNPFGTGVMYRTGDLAVRHGDNSIEIVGRRDHQVKIRGFRVELDEIQCQLSGHPDVAQAHVLVDKNSDMVKLLAFVIAVKGKEVSQQGLLDYLKQRLPHYMIPNSIVQLHQFALNANGKIDRHKLLEQAQQPQVLVTPKNSLEKQLLAIWQQVLQNHHISVMDDFFALGGHSLAAIKVIGKIRQQLGCELANDCLFHYKTIRALAHYLQGNLQHKNTSNPRLIPLAQANSKHTMVLMHSHTGHFNYHQGLIANLSHVVDIVGITADSQLWLSAKLGDIDTIVDDYIEQLLPLKSKPLILTGWSLGGKLMVLMAKRMKALGFTISAVAIIDFDLAQTLTVTDDAQQLIEDFNDYIALEQIGLSSEQVELISSNLGGNYQQAMQQLLRHPQINNLVDQTSAEDIEQRMMQRWQFKQQLYQAATPVIDNPIWLWRGNGFVSPPQIWQAHSSVLIQSWTIDADHYAILNHPQLAAQLQQNIEQLSVEKVVFKKEKAES